MKVVSGPINWVEVGNDRLHADQGELTLFVARESSNSWLFWASRPRQGQLYWLASRAGLPSRAAAIAAAEAWLATRRSA